MNWIISIVGALISALVAIAFVVGMENLRKPRLVMGTLETRTHDYGEAGGKPAKILRVCELQLKNLNLPRIVKWFMSRNAAIHCYGYITFYKVNGEIAINGRMPIKWANLPRVEVYPGGTKIEHSLYEVSYMDVHPGEKEIIQVAAMFDNESDCYGWNNESYYQGWRNPNWKLSDPGDFFVDIMIISPGLRCEDVFKLHFGKDPDDFNLEKAESLDKARIISIQKSREILI